MNNDIQVFIDKIKSAISQYEDGAIVLQEFNSYVYLQLLQLQPFEGSDDWTAQPWAIAKLAEFILLS